ncbi:MAG TPA: MarR family transcriptional regulator [Gemmatirosa sp.]
MPRIPKPPTAPPRESAGTHAWLILMKAYRALLRYAERNFAALDIGLTDFVILEMLLHKGPQKVSDIGRRVGLTSGAITSAVDRSERHGLVVRTFDVADRRARVVKLTPRGRSLAERAFACHSAAMDEAMGVLTQAELRTLAVLLKRVGTSVDARDDARTSVCSPGV